MQYKVENIVDYVFDHQKEYSFIIREYASRSGRYSNEAVVFGDFRNEIIGIIFEEYPINPHIYYTKSEMLALLTKLELKARKYINYVGGENTTSSSAPSD